MKLWLTLILVALLSGCASTDVPIDASSDGGPTDIGAEFDVVDHEPDIDDAFGPQDGGNDE